MLSGYNLSMRNMSEAQQHAASPIPTVGPSSDEALVQTFLGGDDEAFHSLFFRKFLRPLDQRLL